MAEDADGKVLGRSEVLEKLRARVLAAAADRERLRLLADAAACLGGRCREVLRRKLEGQSFVEIAKDLGRPVNTVYSWDHRCHQALRRLLGDRYAFVAGEEEP
jgi:DNA-directed RNA polymerase specialized sigma24 family protein